MLKKRLGIEAIEKDWFNAEFFPVNYYKIPSTLIIPESCEKIGNFTFNDCHNLRKVIIPESVDWIGINVFGGSEKKATVILKKPKSEFKFVGLSAFKDCKDVKEETRDWSDRKRLVYW